ncbi:MAG: hypothetical protein QQN63_08900 [Nitrosopumilus sp.]
MIEKKIETLVEDIYEVLDTPNHKANKHNLAILGDDIAAAIATSMNRDSTPSPTIRASSIGKACNRQQWYDLKGFEGLPLQPNTRLMFMYGHIVEALLLFLAKEAGHSVSAEQAEIEVDGIKGHIDALIDGVVVDVKSASTRSFEKFADGTLKDDDPFGYMKQIGFYQEGLGMRGGFLAMDKQYGHLAWLEVKAPVSVRPRIKELKEIEKMTDEPVRAMAYNPRPLGKSGNMTLCTECKYCSHKLHCWTDANGGKGLRAFMYSNGPVFLTDVKNLPKVPEVV